MRRTIFLVAVFCLSVLHVAAQQPVAQEFSFAANQSVYVIAVKSPAPQDQYTWLQLRRNLPNAQVANVPTGTWGNDTNNRTTLEKSPTERPTLERETPLRRSLPPIEPQLKKLIEEEFLKQKKFKLADSPQTADFIFFAHGEYVFSFFVGGGKSSGGTGVVIMSGQGDTNMELNTLAKLSLAAIPVSDYRHWQSDVASLFEKAKWRETVWGEIRRDLHTHYEEPPTKKLVQQFHKQVLKK